MAIFLGVSFYYVTKLTQLPKVTKNEGVVIFKYYNERVGSLPF